MIRGRPQTSEVEVNERRSLGEHLTGHTRALILNLFSALADIGHSYYQLSSSAILLNIMALAVLLWIQLVALTSAHRMCTKCISLSDLLAEGYGIEITAQGLYKLW